MLILYTVDTSQITLVCSVFELEITPKALHLVCKPLSIDLFSYIAFCMSKTGIAGALLLNGKLVHSIPQMISIQIKQA